MIARYRRELSVAVAFGIILLLLAIAAARFYAPDQLRAFVVSSAPVLVAAVVMTLVILCRQIDSVNFVESFVESWVLKLFERACDRH